MAMSSMEWDLPAPEELMPLTQSLITPELAGAFSIPHDFFKQQQQQQPPPPPTTPPLVVGSGGPDLMNATITAAGFDEEQTGSAKKVKKPSVQQVQQDDSEEAEAESGNSGGDEPSARTLKRPRLVWTPQLHKRFVDAVAQLGIKSAVPKTIMQLMNVDGLTRENVASHLQKYRLYLKRMQGIPSDGPPSATDPLFASTPVPPGLAASAAHFLQGHHEVIPVPFAMSTYAAAAQAASFDHHHAFGGAAAAAAAMARQQQQQQLRMPSGDLNEHVLSGSMVDANVVALQQQQHQHQQQQQQSQQGSPPRQVLTLFPTSSH